jgi:4-hydroxy-2-oxoheptanedioate aldolase
MLNKMRAKMLDGKKVIGLMFESGNTTIAECCALAGLDYIIIDTEHGPFEAETVMELCCTCARRGMTPLVRVKEISRPAILKMLDVGAMGLIIPCVKTIDEIKQIISYGKYFPKGNRGVAFARGNGFGYAEPKPLTEYFEDCNRETMLIPQCETKECLEQIETVVNIDGVDGIFVGPYDLSTALGKPGQFDDPEVVAAIARVLQACKAAKKPAFIYADTAEAAHKHYQNGFDSVCCCLDTVWLVRAVQQMMKEALPK